MRTYRPSGELIVANKRFKIDAPVVNFEEGPLWNAKSIYCIPTETENPLGKCQTAPNGGHYPYAGPKITQRYSTRPALRRYGDNPPIEAVQAVVRQFVIHHDGCHSADMCFNVLQNERGLSCHFLVDNDGTIFQTLDLALAGWHAAAWNFGSIGVEFCNYGDAKARPDFYSSGKHGINRDVTPCKINGHKILAFDYTPAQYDAFARLVRGLQKVLPNIPIEFPQASPGVQSWDTLPEQASFGFAGYIAHYHLTNQKWDPGPFDFKERLGKLRGRLSLPIFAKEPKDALDVPYVPEAREDLQAVTEELYKANEVKADGGFFPVGPWGEARLWHGGVHLTAKVNASVFSPFPARLVAARMGASSAVGSNNFVLLRHEMSLGQAKVQFYSLYMHLAEEPKLDKKADWITKSERWIKESAPGKVQLLDEPIEAGALIGHVGTAGPGDLAKPQLHVSFFSISELFTDFTTSRWEVIDGSAGGRFCDVPRINDLIDSNQDGKLSRQELTDFYAGGGGQQMRNFVTFHVSEWTAEPSWADALRVPADFKDLKPAEIDALVAEQITPGLWWDAATAKHCRLPVNGEVYHYHPVSFVAWFNEQLIEAAATAPKETLTAADTSEVPPTITDDFGDKDGSSMRSGVDIADDPCNKNLGLQDLVLGYDAPECGPQ